MQIIERDNPVFSNLRKNISTIGSVAIQKKLKDIQRQQELQDAVRKAVITSVLSGKGKFKTPVDINQLISDGQMPNLSEFEPTMDYGQLGDMLRTQRLSKQLERERTMGVMGGIEEPSIEDVTQFTPQLQKPILGLGRAEGGEVVLPKEAIYAEGQILSPTRETIGEYAPGYEPKKVGNFPVFPEEVAGAMRTKFAGGIPKEDLARKAMGIPFTGRATQGQIVNLATKMAQAENPLAGEKEIQAKIPIAQKMLQGNIFSGQRIDTVAEVEYSDEEEQIIQDNMEAYPDKTREEIIEAMQAQGYL